MRNTSRTYGLSHINNAQRNRQILLSLLWENGELSRKELASLAGLSIATIKRIVEDLLREKIVIETGSHKSKRGKRTQLLSLNSGFGYALGLNLRQNAIDLTVLSPTGTLLYEETRTHEGKEKEEVFESIKLDIRHVLDTIQHQTSAPLLGIGVGIPALVDSKQGLVFFCPGLPGWEMVHLSAELQKDFSTDILVDDNSRCMALAERLYGHGKGLNDFLFICVDEGVGGGIFIDGRLYRGKHGIAGELGHILIKENGPRCRCGSIGCLEALVSKQAILHSATELIASDVFSNLRKVIDANGFFTLKDIYNEAKAGDKLSNIVINTAGECLGIGLADFVNVFDPGIIVLGGEVVTAFQELLHEEILRTVKLKSMYPIFSQTLIKQSHFNNNSASLGAAAMIVGHHLGDSILNI
ncbi:MAG: ROK family transcriptional regulator [bacterium]|nr:ROK family transcriptional regulator [bacterium]